MLDVQLKIMYAENFGNRLITTKPIPKGKNFFDFSNYNVVNKPNYKTIQINPHEHVEELGVLAYMNHSCDPSVIVDTEKLSCISARDIYEGEELTFFYPSTEWSMAQVFHCDCKSDACIGVVSGAYALPIITLSKYFINHHIIKMMNSCLTDAYKVAR